MKWIVNSKTLCVVALAATLWGCLPYAENDQQRGSLAPQMPPPAHVQSGNTFGSGVPTAYGILTSAHVLQGETAVINFGREIKGTLYFGESGTLDDVALIPYSTRFSPPINCGPLRGGLQGRAGKEVWYRGWHRVGNGFVPTTLKGRIANHDVRMSDQPFDRAVAIDMQIAPGMSGGGVYDNRGELIGIVAGLLSSYGSRYALMVPLPEIVCGDSQPTQWERNQAAIAEILNRLSSGDVR